MTDETRIKRLRSTCQRLYDYADRIDTVTGLPWSRTPLAQAVRNVLAETEPETDPQQQLDTTPAA